MKFVLYIDYRASCKPMYSEYRPMKAKTLVEAIVEADAIHNFETMYLIRIMEKSGRARKVASDVKANVYEAILEKRSTKWAAMDRKHSVNHFTAKFGNWYETAEIT